MKKYLFFSLAILFYFLIFNTYVFATTAPTHWQTLAPGLAYTEVDDTPEFPFGTIHAFKIDLHKYNMQIAFTQKKLSIFSVADLVIMNNAILGINGGFFSPELTPLGLRISGGKQFSPIKHISWWGIFYVINHQAHIVQQSQFNFSKKISMAVQCGPRLVINGHIPKLKSGVSFRSALGITRDGKVIIAITDSFPLSTDAFAKILATSTRQGGLNCVNALNLDGGSSSQLYAQLNGFYLNLPSFVPVSDAILIMPS